MSDELRVMSNCLLTRPAHNPSLATRHLGTRAFTLIEIALCLAIIGFALLALIIVLPFGLGTQKDSRQETVIGQDASVLIEHIRNGSTGADFLKDYIVVITNIQTKYGVDGQPIGTPAVWKFTPTGSFLNGSAINAKLTNGQRIIGLLSTPQYVNYAYEATNNVFGGGYSNHVVAYVRSLNGLASEKPPQDNGIMRDDAFTYRIYCVNAPVANDTNVFWQSPASQKYFRQLSGGLRELRMTFTWPVQPNGAVGGGRHTFRTTIPGLVTHEYVGGADYYFYEPQNFSPVP
jgi:type II secretory pathway pseudopilin PulG